MTCGSQDSEMTSCELVERRTKSKSKEEEGEVKNLGVNALNEAYIH